MTKYKLIAVDMDGTLLNDELKITERTKAAVVSAVEAGVLFVASTGRPMCALEKNINAVIGKDLPFIIFNGATVMMSKSKKILYSSPLREDYVKQVYEFGTERKIPIVVWTGETLWVNHDCEETRDYQKFSGKELNIIHNITEDCGKSGVSKMLWIGAPDKIARYQKEMDGYFKGGLNCHASRPEFLEFVSAEASKGLALSKIGEAYGIDKSEMIAVGDSYNDVSMLEYAGFSVAMQNAPDDIKAICEYVTFSNNDDGVAAVIEKFVLGGNLCQPN